MKRLSLLLLVWLGAPAVAAVPAAAPPVPALFQDYRAAELCLDLAESLGRQDLALLEQHLDLDDMVRKALPRGLDPQLRANVLTGARASFRATLAQTFTRQKLAWESELQGEGGARQRCTLGAVADGGVVLMDAFIAERESGPRITDIHDYSMGTSGIESMRRFFSYMLPSQSMPLQGLPLTAGFVPAPSGMAPALVDDLRLQRVMEFLGALRSGDAQAIHASFERMPESARRQPTLLIRTIAAMRADDALYREYLSRLAVLVGDNPDYAFVLIDHYILTNDTTRLLRSLLQVESMAPGFLPVLALRLGAEQTEGDAPGTRRAIARMLAVDDGYEPVYWSIVEEAGKRQDFATAVTAFKVLKRRFGYDFTKVDEPADANLRAALASRPFREWMQAEAAASAAQ
ncbi:MAG: hypothetical protein V4729_12785 [Pseudomonadota bacterium]